MSGPPLFPTFSGTPPSSVSVYRWVISSTGITSINADVMFDLSQCGAGISDPNSVTVYSRPVEGSGSFTALPTTYDAIAGELIAVVSGFGEFVFGSDSSPLPIQLSMFTADVCEEGFVSLKWKTLTETGNYGFEIQKSHNLLSSYETILNSFTAGQGTSQSPRTYTYVDSLVTPGVWYYRLKQIDLDRSVHYSDATRIEILTNSDRVAGPKAFMVFQNYPNPFNASTTIRYGLPIRSYVSLSVFNTLGQKVATLVEGDQDVGYHSAQFDASGLSSGIYIYRIAAGNRTQTRKIVLVR